MDSLCYMFSYEVKDDVFTNFTFNKKATDR